MRVPSCEHLPADQALRHECCQRQPSTRKKNRTDPFITRHAQNFLTRQLDRVDAGANDPSHLQFQNVVRALSTT